MIKVRFYDVLSDNEIKGYFLGERLIGKRRYFIIGEGTKNRISELVIVPVYADLVNKVSRCYIGDYLELHLVEIKEFKDGRKKYIFMLINPNLEERREKNGK